MTPRRPLLSPWHRLVEEPDRLVLEYGGEAVSLEGGAVRTLLPALLPLLDGTSTVDEIEMMLGERAQPAIAHALELLAEHGLLTEGPPLDAAVPQPFAAAALHHAAVDPAAPPPAAVHAALAEAAVAVVGSAPAGAELARLLRSSGVRHVRRGGWEETPQDELTVVAPLAKELPLLPGWNETALEARAAWLQVLPYNGVFAAVGPVYVPGETCCYECYRRRRVANVDYPDEFWALERAAPETIDPPGVAALAAGVATILCLRRLLTGDPFSAGAMTAIELGEAIRVTRHVVYRIPRCPACSASGRLAQPLPWAEAS